MGRKPNQLILEFFIRGQKLEDASNRYQHTCKACGEKFPKGRIDSLTNHLVKKCTAIPLRDRQRVLLRLHELPDLADGDQNKDPNAAGQNKGKPGEVSFTTRQNFDGLNVLAEASRQVGASDQSKRGAPAFPQSVTVGGKTVVVDPALEAEGFQGHPTQSDQMDEDVKIPVSPNTPTDATAIPSLPPTGSLDPSSASPPLPETSMTPDPTAASRQSQLSMIAASASEMVPHGLPLDHDPSSGLSDGLSKMSSAWNQQLSTQEQLLFDSLQEHDPTLTAATQRAASFPRPIAMNPASQTKGFVNEFGNSTKPAKPKVRGRFSAARRREVQEVRKRGACIRCRMLKKPCSGDSPCTTCASVESARLWKHPCIRTRIADEFELFNANLHATLAFHDVGSIRNQVKFDVFAGRIEVTHFEESLIFVTLAGQQGHKTSTSTLDPQLQGLGDDPQFQGPLQEVYLLDSDMEDIPGKVELYIKKTGSMFYEREASDIMRPTLMLAAELAAQKKDLLLERVLELWVATHILVDVDTHWKTFSNPSLPPASYSFAQPTDDGRIPIDEITNPESYALLCGQLRAATEKRAAALSKSVMNDLERRLLQRQQSGWFETFLVSLILLNCVERTCWLFRSWDDENFTQRWPLEKRPQSYAAQGDRFSDILHMLLKMRSLPPKAKPLPDSGVLEAVEGSDENAIRWFDMIKVTPLYLEQRQTAGFDPTDCRSFDLRYGSKLLPTVYA
ncbi:uncharacterized protein DSM5745_06399 [Aspergillus mulundensis]|uniref:Putative Zn(II)2Cys6 transcription factor n=1 Tax=Aspergillus mulundensis TaxID=1810919 RepID=A0A3D8RQP3_9EURO|nr:putative Zn(II)2Cys6 transcription factor [Aspergillus mulundensis]RDW76407.1 putative Zn(II)2Cys6 transcription factor [Aspergillus mulundensis]